MTVAAATHREHVELMRCLRLLAEAIAAADRWYARRERELANLDRRATRTLDRLRAGGHVRPSLAWAPKQTVGVPERVRETGRGVPGFPQPAAGRTPMQRARASRAIEPEFPARAALR